MTTRQRRPLNFDPSSASASESQSYGKHDKPGKSDGDEEADKGLGFFLPVFALGMLRYMSATSNIIHDCDEVFNCWEPLHYLIYKSGFQTWEYSSQFALRSYFYILFHKLVGWPASCWYGWLGEEKVRVFYVVRIFLGLLSVVTEAALVVALSRKYGKRLATYTLAMLCLISGFLPSSFSMYAISLSSALFLFEKHAMAVVVAATGVNLGWPFSMLAFTGGGESHLYGTEGPLYYFKNGFNNFNFSFVLALLFLGVLPIARKKYAPDLLVVVSPMYIWIAFMSLQPHKEERFLYPIYPLVCIAASTVIDSFPDIFRDKYNSNDKSLVVTIAKYLRPFVLGIILCVSHARTFSLIHGYSAPLEIYKHLEYYDVGQQGSVVCVGSEWHHLAIIIFHS